MIETALTLGLVFDLRLRQTESFMTSVLKLIDLNLAVADHTALSRRASKLHAPDKKYDNRILSERVRPRPDRSHRFAGLRRGGGWRWMPIVATSSHTS